MKVMEALGKVRILESDPEGERIPQLKEWIRSYLALRPVLTDIAFLVGIALTVISVLAG